MSERLVCCKEVKRLLLEDCKNIFLKYHPDFEGMKLSENFLLGRVIDFYINTEQESE